MKTFSAKPTDISRNWHIIDASEAPIGRLATRIATLLTGKEKPLFTKHIDCGDHVIVINSDALVVTGKKQTNKVYYRHSGYPGGLKETTLGEQIEKDSRKVVEKAVRGMLPANKLRPQRLQRLRIYKDDQHQHDAQKPVKINMKEGQ